MHRWTLKQKGFTIVELLIVIVVIGILAAITIVSFNGVQNRAKIASVQTDLTNAAQSLETYKYSNSSVEAYPVDLAAANLKSSNGTSYQYTVNNVVSPASYCLNAGNGTTIDYFISNANTTPQVGGCPTTNLVTNPSFETNTNDWSAVGSTIVRSTEQKYVGQASLKVTPSAAPYNGTAFTAAGTIGVQYTFSAYVYSPTSQYINFAADCCGNSNPIIGPSWQRIVVSGVRVNNQPFYIRAIGSGGLPFYVDAVMVNESTSAYDYKDGTFTSNSWIWSGTANNSTSSGSSQ